jgi:hypothetical protein
MAFHLNIAPCSQSVNAAEGQCSGIAMAAAKNAHGLEGKALGLKLRIMRDISAGF